MGACGKNHNHRLEHTQAQEHKLPVTNTSSTYNYNHTQRHFISHFTVQLCTTLNSSLLLSV